MIVPTISAFDAIVNPEIRKACGTFAADYIATTQKIHEKRGQTNDDARLVQAEIGKLAEFASYDWIHYKKHACTEPDLEIYTRETKKKKSFDADLLVDGTIKCHVKGQDHNSANRFGLSWMFQYRDRNGNMSGHWDKEIFDTGHYTANDFVTFNLVRKDRISIMACVRIATLHAKECFELPMKPELQVSKRVIYYDSLLKKLSIDELWDGLE